MIRRIINWLFGPIPEVQELDGGIPGYRTFVVATDSFDSAIRKAASHIGEKHVLLGVRGECMTVGYWQLNCEVAEVVGVVS